MAIRSSWKNNEHMDAKGFIRFTARDLLGKTEPLADNQTYIKAGAHWLECATHVSGDGGVSAQYSLLTGWGHSYIETTGYILVTFFSLARHFRNVKYRTLAIGMADFLLKNQLDSGAFSSGTPRSKIIPRVFNTGEAMRGLITCFRETKKRKYLDAAVRAADWLCSCQSSNGSWEYPEYMNTPHSYHSRTSHVLLLIWQETLNKQYLVAARKNLDWALTQQRKNGWFALCKFAHPEDPFTHAISYTIDGLIESARITHEKRYWDAAEKCSFALLRYYEKEQRMPATFDDHWESTDRYTCLTGNAQIVINWLAIYEKTKNIRYLNASGHLLTSIKQTISLDQFQLNTYGAVPGAYPTYGGYSRWNFPNWATKFLLDACIQFERT